MTETIWVFLAVQIAMGAFDTGWHHELTERLAWRPSQHRELGLHAVRNIAYAVMFAVLGWSEPHGGAALALLVLMFGELGLTLWDFVEEDRSRRLPPSERVLHTLLTLNYGVVLALLVPVLIGWAAGPTAVLPAYHGGWSWLCAVSAAGVLVSGVRDWAAARRAGRLVTMNADMAGLAAGLAGRRRAVLVTGGTGFIGSRLVAALVAAGHEVTVLTRARERAAVLTRERANAATMPVPLRIVTDLDQIDAATRIDAIVNLAGEPIAAGPWTARRRRRILRSRLRVTREVVALIGRLAVAPAVLVSGSAIGWYGLSEAGLFDEGSAGDPCFSRRLCLRWEAAAGHATVHGTRLVLLRTGLVLAAEGGMLAPLLTPFEWGLGGRIGGGRQWMSWIHRDDLVRLIVHAIASPGVVGPINAVAPGAVRNAEFARALGAALRRPAWLPVPAAPLRLLGEFAEELLLGGQRVVPAAALRGGFRFAFPELGMALEAIVGRRGAGVGAGVVDSGVADAGGAARLVIYRPERALAGVAGIDGSSAVEELSPCPHPPCRQEATGPSLSRFAGEGFF